MLAFSKLLLSLVTCPVCIATGVAAGVGVAFCLLREEGGEPEVAVVSLLPAQEDTAGAVWPPAPSNTTG